MLFVVQVKLELKLPTITEFGEGLVIFKHPHIDNRNGIHNNKYAFLGAYFWATTYFLGLNWGTPIKLSKPQPNLNTTVGFDMKMTLQTPPHHPKLTNLLTILT